VAKKIAAPRPRFPDNIGVLERIALPSFNETETSDGALTHAVRFGVLDRLKSNGIMASSHRRHAERSAAAQNAVALSVVAEAAPADGFADHVLATGAR
jgi:hypothetical protein